MCIGEESSRGSSPLRKKKSKQGKDDSTSLRRSKVNEGEAKAAVEPSKKRRFTEGESLKGEGSELKHEGASGAPGLVRHVRIGQCPLTKGLGFLTLKYVFACLMMFLHRVNPCPLVLPWSQDGKGLL